MRQVGQVKLSHFLYCRKILLVGRLSVQDKYNEPKIFFKFAYKINNCKLQQIVFLVFSAKFMRQIRLVLLVPYGSKG